MTPWVTGLHFASRGETDTDEIITKRVDNALYYIDNWSLLLDLQILAMTAFAVFGREDAY